MNREEFLMAVAARLRGLPEADIEKSLDYYREMIDDRIEDGMSEEGAVAAMGSPEDAAAQILEEMSLPKLVKARLKPSRALRVWEIILLVLGSPIWLPLVLAFSIVILTVYLVLLLLVFMLYVFVFSSGVTGVVSVPAFLVMIFTGKFYQAALTLGTGCVFAGFAILLFMLSKQATVWVLALIRLMARAIKRMFIRKGEAQ